MLQTAQAKRREGVDVVVGVVETHGRKETQALAAGLEVVPRRRVEYKGRWLDEMDIDAILARRPQLVLVDELAHSNAPVAATPSGTWMSRNCSTPASMSTRPLNIQHVESTQRPWSRRSPASGSAETVPDSVIDGPTTSSWSI